MSEFTYPGYTVETDVCEQQDPRHPPFLIRHIDAMPDNHNLPMATCHYCVGICKMDGSFQYFSEAKIAKFKRQAWDNLVLLFGSGAVKARLEQVARGVGCENAAS